MSACHLILFNHPLEETCFNEIILLHVLSMQVVEQIVGV